MNIPAIPNDKAAEESIVGSILLDNGCIPVVTQLVTSQDFHDRELARIYEAQLNLFNRGATVDNVTLCAELGGYELIGRIATCVSATPTPASAQQYAQIVKDHSTKRKLIEASGRIAQAGYELGAEQAYAEAQRILLGVAPKVKGGFRSAESLAADAIIDFRIRVDDPREITGYRTGYLDLDKKLDGIKTGLHVWTGAASMGKTALALGSLLKMAQQGTKVGILSLEMTSQQLTTRLLGYLSGIPSACIESGYIEGRRLNSMEIKRVEQAGQDLADLPLYLANETGATSTSVRAQFVEMKSRYGVQVYAVDYIQLLTEKAENENLALDLATRNLLACAHDLDAPIIALSQLKRGVEGRDVKIPTLADLRGSGGIEQNADVVLAIVNPDYYNKFIEKYEKKNEVWLYVLKDRLTGTGVGKSVMLRFIERTGAVENAVRV